MPVGRQGCETVWLMFQRSHPVLRPRRVSFEVDFRDKGASHSGQGVFEIHGQDGGANPHFRSFLTVVSDAIQSAVVLSVAEGTLDAVALLLLFLEPAFRGLPILFRVSQRLEGGAHSPLLHQPAVLTGSVKTVSGEGGRKFPELLAVCFKLGLNDFAGGFREVVVMEFVEKQETVDITQRPLGAKLGILAPSPSS